MDDDEILTDEEANFWFGRIKTEPTESYDEWALKWKKLADKKFKGQRIKRILKDAAGFYARFSVAWLYVFVISYFFVPRLFAALNASDHLAGFSAISYLEGSFTATLLLWVTFVLFRVLTD